VRRNDDPKDQGSKTEPGAPSVSTGLEQVEKFIGSIYEKCLRKNEQEPGLPATLRD
jgi:hypothetical protein